MKRATRPQGRQQPAGALFGVSRTNLREPQRCAECGTGLARGTQALVYPVTRAVACIECPTPRPQVSW